MAELVDAADSKSAILMNVSVQVGLGVPIRALGTNGIL
jgi:hypothetical protein